MVERRRLERFRLSVPAKIGVMGPGQEKEMLDVLTSDICSSGAFFHTEKPLPEGTEVKIDLVLPVDKLKELRDECLQAHIKLRGTVLRSISSGMAICFNGNYEIRPCRVSNNNSASSLQSI